MSCFHFSAESNDEHVLNLDIWDPGAPPASKVLLLSPPGVEV